jgi:hypothetical protein
MADVPQLRGLREVLTDIIEGRIVKRSKHELTWGTRDVSPEFVELLEEHGYRPALVKDVKVDPGERVPGFFLDRRTAYFGWVFWEKFTRLKLRKLFGSVVRNEKGDWAIQIAEKRMTVVYANPDLKSEMDIDNPSGF